MVNFGETLRTLRKEAGMTQTELANRLNVTKSVVSYYELQERTPSPEVLVKLTNVFHISADYLLGIRQDQSLDCSGLTEDDIRLVRMIIETLRKKNEEK